jgi:peptidoglycan/xylan/chitin deacetylase (PgdA/CDA1 family)
MAYSIKKSIINLISLFFLLFRTVIRVLLFQQRKYVNIFYYHSIPAEEIDNFIWQIEFLSKHGEIVTPDNVHNTNNTEHKFILTFDDGFRSVIKNALPELEKKNIPSILFIPSNYIGKKPDWGKFVTLVTNNENVIDNEELKKLKSDVMEIGSHGTSHIKLSKLNTEKLISELTDSKVRLEELLGYEIKYLSVPFGDYNQAVINMAKKVGYKFLFCTEPGYSSFDENEYVKRRVEIETSDSKFEFILKVFGGYNWRPAASKLKKIIFSFRRTLNKTLLGINNSIRMIIGL